MNIGINARKVINARYGRLKPNNTREDWGNITERVVNAVVKENDGFKKTINNLIYDRKFIPNTPCLVNADPNKKGQLAACFVLGIEDNMESILDTMKNAGLIHKTGGGTGFDFSKLRPEGSPVNGKLNAASGPVSFMKMYNAITDTIKQGGVRRGANMAVLRVDHPDILKFIEMKQDQTTMTNFNVSVAVTDIFMEAVTTNNPYTLNNGRTLRAREVWDKLCASAHKWGEPGIIFIDTVNRHNLLKPALGDISSCNPCGEQFLHSNNSCNLGSIDVSKLYDEHNQTFDWDQLRIIVRAGIEFLDLVIDACEWPTEAIKQTVLDTRPIGLGIMGFADLLLKMKISYNSSSARNFARSIMKFIRAHTWGKSVGLARVKGTFPLFKMEAVETNYKNFFKEYLTYPNHRARNYQTTTIVPTGTVSIVAECSSGIEPNFAWAYHRKDSTGENYYVHPLAAKALGITYDNQNEADVIRAAKEVSKRINELPEYFVTAHDIKAMDHLNMLAAFQQYTDNSISKTVNGDKSDTIEDVKTLYMKAWGMGVKCVSYYRDGSRDAQVLTAIKEEDKNEIRSEETKTDAVVLRPELQGSSKGDQVPVSGNVPATSQVRPRLLHGTTFKYKLSSSTLFITINTDNSNHPREVFIIEGTKSSSKGILISKMLQSGFSLEKIISILQKIPGDEIVWENKQCFTSVEQILAQKLKAFIILQKLDNIFHEDPVDYENENSPVMASESPRSVLCTRCHVQVPLLDNCASCANCGYSKCT